MTETLTDLAVTLSALYVADDMPGYPQDALERIALADLNSPALKALAAQLALAGDAVDGYLCDIDRYSHAPDGHDLCCDGECDCAQPSGPFAHPMCSDCEQAPMRSRDESIGGLLALLDSWIRHFVEHLTVRIAA